MIGGVASFHTLSVGVTGFEPATLWSQTRYATGLRYTPNAAASAGISIKKQTTLSSSLPICRGDWIRTSDLQLPKLARLPDCATPRTSALIVLRAHKDKSKIRKDKIFPKKHSPKITVRPQKPPLRTATAARLQASQPPGQPRRHREIPVFGTRCRFFSYIGVVTTLLRARRRNHTGCNPVLRPSRLFHVFRQ